MLVSLDCNEKETEVHLERMTKWVEYKKRGNLQYVSYILFVNCDIFNMHAFCVIIGKNWLLISYRLPV